MKGYGAAAGGVSTAAQAASKRRSKGQAAAVFVLVFFSMLVPLVFLLGLHNRFPSGYLADDRTQQVSKLARMMLGNCFDRFISPNFWFWFISRKATSKSTITWIVVKREIPPRFSSPPFVFLLVDVIVDEILHCFCNWAFVLAIPVHR
ncbi:hypothetical protein B296_00037079 [Ensete ventricosum]|uniref:Uncharacterized protein n=1 Tax=Ensete ventricosum TaxID=4639 RepID=A0A427A0G2_ENSVE|nr:hypothetical protein B296_00037079 [Ensete ventricosum]